MKSFVNIFWFRRDLRLEDNCGLFQALRAGRPVVPIFIFDSAILDSLDEKSDKRVWFIHSTLHSLQLRLGELGSALEIYHGSVVEVFRGLLAKYNMQAVFANDDYEPYATLRDMQVEQLLQASGVGLVRFKDQVIFEKSEVLKPDGQPYTVFTPYSRRWKSHVASSDLAPYPTMDYAAHFCRQAPHSVPSLASLGFRDTPFSIPSVEAGKALIAGYDANRDFPDRQGTTRLGLHLRFGTLSIRELVRLARIHSEAFYNELIWREFFQMILWHFPQVGRGKSFKPRYEFIQWRNEEREFDRWCRGMTGYPLVDAGMRELNQTGFMHNRVRMIAASFLSKHLLVDWRWGEAYFAERLLDFDLAANNGGWQWAAGCGCDAAPYFRVFSPELQAQKFDPDFRYIRSWIPELGEPSYPGPIVDHATARARALETYARALRRELPH
jgi:deoxyribodipyrimidine photo-lyase